MLKRSIGVLALSAAFLAGCGNGNNVTDSGNNGDTTNNATEENLSNSVAMENFRVGDTFRANEPIDVSMIFRQLPTSPFNDEWMMVQRLREITNVYLDVTAVMHEDFETQRNLLIGAGDAPEIMPFAWAGHETQFIAGGTLLPISDYFEHMPHFMHFVEEWGLEEPIENLRQADGNIYLLPGLQQDPRVRFSVAMRQDILDELGLDAPDSWEEIRDVLRVVAEERPDITPYNDRWNLDATLNIAASTWGIGAGWGFGSGLHLNHNTNEFEYVAQMDELKDFVMFWNSLIEEGLLHPESLTQGCGPAWEAFVNGESFMIAAGNTLEEYIRDFDANIEAGATHLEGYELVQLPVPNGPTGKIGEQLIDNGMMLNASLRDREDFVAILQFIDWLWYSEEGREFAMWGIEGETFQWNEEGYRELLSGFQHRGHGLNINPDYDDIQVDHGFMENVWALAGGSSRDLMTSVMTEEARALHIYNADTRVLRPITPRIPWTDLELEQISIIQSALADHTRSNMSLFILGQRSMDDWDTFVQEIESMGSQRFVDMANEAWSRR